MRVTATVEYEAWLKFQMLKSQNNNYTWRDAVESGIKVLCGTSKKDELENELKEKIKEVETIKAQIKALDSEKNKQNQTKSKKQMEEAEKFSKTWKIVNPLRHL